MGKNASINEKTDLPRHLFWDFRYAQIEWKEEYHTIIQRVLERGTNDDWKEMIRFYSEAKVIRILTSTYKPEG